MSFERPVIHLTDQARNDILVILTHTNRRWGRDQRDRYRLLLEEGLERIRQFPLIGEIDNPSRPIIRRRLVAHHVVFYEIRDIDVIVVLRILHERMNLSEWQNLEERS